MYYKVTEYNGDFQMENQTFWNEDFRSFKAADFVAKSLYYYPDTLKSRGYDYYVLVESFSNVRDIGMSLIAYTKNGPLTEGAIAPFLAQYEQRERVEIGETVNSVKTGEGGENDEYNGAREIHVYNHPAYSDYPA